MKTFKLTLFKGHPIITTEGNIILIDTGAPSTIHNTNQLNFVSDTYNASSNYMGLTTDKLSELMGMKITTLLGADILSEFKILFDYKNSEVTFSKNKIEFEGQNISINSFMGIPIIEIEIEGGKIKCFLDTGAKLSYLLNTLTRGHQNTGTDEDFYPGVGRFTTDCFNIDTSFGNETFSVKYGNLPTLLEMTLMLAGTNGIIGYDFFNNFKILLDLNKNEITCAKQADGNRRTNR